MNVKIIDPYYDRQNIIKNFVCLINLCEQTQCAFGYDAEECYKFPIESRIGHYLDGNSIQNFWVKFLVVDGKRVGFINYVKYYERPAGFINYLVIDKSYRKHGYATLLMQHVLADLQELGCKEVRLKVACPNLKFDGCPSKISVCELIRFYQKLGFVIVRNSDPYFITMVKQL